MGELIQLDDWKLEQDEWIEALEEVLEGEGKVRTEALFQRLRHLLIGGRPAQHRVDRARHGTRGHRVCHGGGQRRLRRGRRSRTPASRTPGLTGRCCCVP